MNQLNNANEGGQPNSGWQPDQSQPTQPAGSTTNPTSQDPYGAGQSPADTQGYQGGANPYPSYQNGTGYQQQPSSIQPTPAQPLYQDQQTPITSQTGAAQPTYQAAPTPTPAPTIPAPQPYGTQQQPYGTSQPNPAQPTYQGQAFSQQQQPYRGQFYGQQAGYQQNVNQQPGYPQPGVGPQTPAYPVGAGYAYTGEPPLNAPWYGIDFINACKRFFRKYATFSGRASRGEYWWAYLMNVLISIVFAALSYPLGIVGSILANLVSLALVVPTIAVGVRRLHDSNMSGLWCLLPLGTSFVGIILLIIGFGTLVTASAGASIVLFSAGGLIALAGTIATIVFMIRPSDPQGARYDTSS